MSFTAHAEMDTGSENRYTGYLSLGTERRGHQTVMVFNGPDGLETTIRFTEITIGRNSIAFYSTTRGRESRRVKTGMVEAQPDIVQFLQNAVEESGDLTYDVVDDR